MRLRSARSAIRYSIQIFIGFLDVLLIWLLFFSEYQQPGGMLELLFGVILLNVFVFGSSRSYSRFGRTLRRIWLYRMDYLFWLSFGLAVPFIILRMMTPLANQIFWALVAAAIVLGTWRFFLSRSIRLAFKERGYNWLTGEQMYYLGKVFPKEVHTIPYQESELTVPGYRAGSFESVIRLLILQRRQHPCCASR